MDVQTFDVTVEREGRWWVFAIPELGTGGQARSLAEVEHEAQGVAAMWLDVAPETVAVRVAPSAPADALNEWQAADRDEAAARDAQARAAARRRAVVVKLREAGYTAADTGAVLGITKQRVYQIEKPREAVGKH
jgi:predicted RNase H-like HicB family nuclease